MNEQLAINGGPKAAPNGLSPRRLFSEEEKRSVMELFDQAIEQGSDLLGYNGPQEEAYCHEFAQMLGGGFADAVNSGTSAVYVAVAATEPPRGSEIIVPPVSDPGGVMPVAMLNCVPVAADVEEGCVYNTGPRAIEKVITERTYAILVAHIAGMPVDMDGVMKLARKHNLKVIEDCAQAPLAKYKGQPVGTIGDIGAFSTMFGKHFATAGQGGMVFTKNEQLYWAARRYADRGKPFGLKGVGSNVVCSLNLNMDELHAAIGRAGLVKLPGNVKRRRDIAARVARAINGKSKALTLITDSDNCESSCWFLVVRLDTDAVTVDKQQFVEALAHEGLPASSGYPFYPMRMEWIKTCDIAPADLPNALANDSTHFRITIHEGLTDSDIDVLVKCLDKVEKAFLR